MNIFTLSKYRNRIQVGWFWPVALVVVVVAAIGISSCSPQPHPTDSPTVVQAGFMEADALITNAQTEIAMLEAKATTGIPLTPDEAATLARMKAWVNKTSLLLQDAQARAAAAGRPPDTGDLITGLAPLLGPVGIPLSIVSGALAEWWRTRKKRTSFDALVGAIDKVKKTNTKLADAFEEAGPALKLEMGTSAAGVVRKLRKKVA